MNDTVAVETQAAAAPETGMAKAVYALYLAGLLFGITGLIGVVIAYVNKGENAPEMLNSHYQFQIRTFWMGLLFLFVAGLTAVLVVGYFVALFWVVWLIVRCVKGWSALNRGAPIANPKSWGFGG